MDKILDLDKKRYRNGSEMPFFQLCFRNCQNSNIIISMIWRFVFKYAKMINCIDLDYNTQIGEGLYIGHPYGIVIHPKAILGKNVSIHKGVTIGIENRGARKGVPVIGNKVWIGVNATVVGKIKIGDDVLIAANSYINKDVPSHSVVFGSPCIIKHRDNATEGYIVRTV